MYITSISYCIFKDSLNLQIERLARTDSDFAAFLHHAGIPCVDLYYGKGILMPLINNRPEFHVYICLKKVLFNFLISESYTIHKMYWSKFRLFWKEVRMVESEQIYLNLQFLMLIPFSGTSFEYHCCLIIFEVSCLSCTALFLWKLYMQFLEKLHMQFQGTDFLLFSTFFPSCILSIL